MPMVKLNISLDEHTAEILRRRAAEQKKPTSCYLAELIVEEDRLHQNALAAEGYRLLSSDTGRFAEMALPLSNETWPDWEIR